MADLIIIAAVMLVYCLIGTLIVSVLFGDSVEALMLVVIWPLLFVVFILGCIGLILHKLHLNPFIWMRKLGFKINDFIINKLER